jgi:hypothetical protein
VDCRLKKDSSAIVKESSATETGNHRSFVHLITSFRDKGCLSVQAIEWREGLCRTDARMHKVLAAAIEYLLAIGQNT